MEHFELRAQLQLREESAEICGRTIFGGLSLWGRARAKGKREIKRAALAQLRLDPDSSRMLFDHHFRNVEAKSNTPTILAIYL